MVGSDIFIIVKVTELNNYAISSDELASALKRSSATLSLMGNSIDESAALITTANSVLQDADSVSAGMRTIALRLVGTDDAEEELQALGEEVDAFVTQTNSKKQQIIKEYTAVASNSYKGFDILDENGNYKNTYDILLGIAKIYKEIQAEDQKLGTNRAVALVEELAGKNRSNVASAILQDPLQLEAVKKSSEEAMGSAQKELDKFLDSIDGKLLSLSNSAQEFWFKIIDSDVIKGGIDALNMLLKLSTGLVDTLGALPTIGLGFGLFKGFQELKGIKELTDMFPTMVSSISNLKDNLHDVANLTKEMSVEYATAVMETAGLTEESIQFVNSLNGVNDALESDTLSKATNTTVTKVLTEVTEEETKAQMQSVIADGTEVVSQNKVVVAKSKNLSITEALKIKYNNLAKSIGLTPKALTKLSAGLLAVGATVYAVKKVNEHLEELREKAKESATELSNNSQSVNEYVERYSQLQTALADAKGNEEETYKIKQDLLTLQNELNEKFGEEYGRLNLVTNAYKDQTDAILKYNKALAHEYLNENSKQVKRGIKKLDAEKEYTLSGNLYTGTEKYDEVKRIADKYKGIELDTDSMTGATTVKITADAYEANETINNFIIDLRERALKLEDESLFDDVINISSKALEKSGSIIDDWGEIVKQGLLSEIAISEELSPIFDNVTKSVEDYNNAVLNSEDPFNDETVKSAWDEMQKLKDELYNDSDWNRYSSILKETFKGANDDVYSFFNTIKSDDSLLKLANDLKGIDATSLRSMANDGVDDSFDKLVNEADKAGVEVEDLITILQKLGIVINEVSNTELEIEEPKLSLSETIKTLDTMKEKLGTLDTAFAKLFDLPKDGTNIGIEDYSSIFDAFSDVKGLDMEKHLSVLRDAGQDTEKVASAMGNLIDEYLICSGVLDNLTDDNKQLLITMLEEMGVVNAEAVVMGYLTNTATALSFEKQFLDVVTQTLSANTLGEIDSFYQEIGASENAQMALSQLALEKLNVNNCTIDTSADIANVLALAEAAGASANAIAKLEKAKAIISGVEAAKSGNGAGVRIDQKAYKEALALMESVENGTFDYGYKKVDPSKYKINTPKAEYKPQQTVGTDTNKALQQSAEDLSKAAKEVKDAFEETFDFAEERIKKVTNAIELLETNLENVVGSNAKNTLIDAQIGLSAEKINNYSDSLAMYTQKANEALSKLPSDIQAKIKNGAIDLTTFMGDGNKEVVEAVKEYSQWADKIADCKQELASLKEAIRDLELAKFNNIMQDFTDQFEIREDSKTLIDKQIALFQEAGQLIGESFFNAKIDQSKKQLEILEQEKSKLAEQLTKAVTSGNVEIGTDEWIEMTGALTNVEGQILDTKKALEEFDNALLDLHIEVFNRIQQQFANLGSEIDGIISLIDDEKVSDGLGGWSKDGLTQLGLLAQKYEIAKYQVSQYEKELATLNQQYAEGRWSTIEYQDRLAELSQAQLDAANSAEDIKDAIIELNELRINESIEIIEKEIDKYKELIDAQIEALKAQKELHDYKQSIAEKTDNIDSLERQIAAMENDTSASTIAKRKLLEEQLSKAKQDLADAEYDHSMQAQEDALNKEFERYESERNAEIEALRLSLEEKEALIFQSFETVKENANIVGEQLTLISQQHGIAISSAIIESWQSGENAIASYGGVLSSATSAFIGQLMNVENEVYTLQYQANATADSLAWMFGTRADNLIGQLMDSYYSEANLNAMTYALRDSLVNTLERGYNISGVTSALNSVAQAASNAANQVAEMNRQLANQASIQTNLAPRPSTSNGTNGSLNKGGGNYVNKQAYYAKGTRNAKGGLSVTDEEGYELKLPRLNSGKYTMVGKGTQIFTAKETDNMFKWSQFDPSKFISSIFNNNTKSGSDISVTNTTSNNPSFEFNGTMMHIENVDSTNIKQMENIAKNAVDKLINKMYKGIKY